jgi:hypothetical protein
MKLPKSHVFLFWFGLLFIALCGFLNDQNYGGMATSAGFIAVVLEIGALIKYMER